MKLCLLLLLLLGRTIATEQIDPELVLAQQWFQRGDRVKSLKLYESVLRRNYDHVEANYSVAKIHFLNQNLEDAWHYFRETLSISGDYRDARALYQQVLDALRDKYRSNREHSAKSYRIRIHLLLLDNNLRDAGLLLDKALPDFSEDGFLWDHKANHLYRQKKIDEAIEALKKAISLNPTSPTIFRHYESAWYQKNLNAAPRSRETTEMARQKVEELQRLKDQGVLGTEDPVSSADTDLDVSSISVTEKPKDQDFLNRLLAQQSKFIQAKPVEKPVEEKPVEVAYVPPPEVTAISQAAEDAERDLIARAQKAYQDRNWNLAVNSYTVLVYNNPKNQEYADLLAKAKAFEDFETRFQAARREFVLASRNPALLDSARDAFSSLDKSLYKQLYHKQGFEDYLGKIAFAKGNFDQAVEFFRWWLQHEPKDHEIYWLAILCLDTLGRWDEAYQLLQAADQVVASQLSGTEGIGRMRTKLTVYSYRFIIGGLALIWILVAFAYTSYKSVIAKRKLDRRRTFEQVRELFAEKSYKRMIKNIDDLMLTELSEAEIYNLAMMKANGLIQLAQWDAAERQVRSIIARTNQDQAAMVLLGRVNVELKRIDGEALPSYRALVQREPTNLELLRLYLASLKAEKSQGEEFERIALKLLELESYNKSVLQDLVEIYAKEQRKTPVAQQIYSQYLDLHPANMLVKLSYLDCLLENGNYIESVKTGKELVNLNPDLEKAHRLLIQAFDKLSMHDEMKSFYAQLSLEYPQNPLVQHMYDLIQENYRGSSRALDDENLTSTHSDNILEEILNTARHMFNNQEYRASIVKLQQVVQEESTSVEAATLLCRAFLAIGDEDSAVLYYESLNLAGKTLGSDELEMIYRMAEIYTARKLRRKALQCYQLIGRIDISYKDTFQRIEMLSLDKS